MTTTFQDTSFIVWQDTTYRKWAKYINLFSEGSRIKTQHTYYKVKDQSLTDRVHVVHGDISKTLIRKNVSSRGSSSCHSYAVDVKTRTKIEEIN